MSEPADAQADRAAQERYTRRLAEAGAVARRFREAANGGDADGAQAQATDAGWSQGRDGLRGLVAQVIHKGLSLDPVGDDPALFGGRGAAWVVISHPSRDAPLGDLFLLLEEGDAGWMVAGATKLRAHVGLFLRGQLPGAVDTGALPESERAADWAAPVLERLRGEREPPVPPAWLTEMAPDDATVEIVGTAALPHLDRAAVGFSFTTADRPWGWESWTILDTSSMPSTVVGTGFGVTLEALLTGLTVPWPKEDPAALGVELTPEERPTDDAGAAAILAGIVRKQIENAGVQPEAATLSGARARALLAYAEQTGRGARRAGPRPDGPVPPELQAVVAQALQEFIEQGVEAPGGLRVNRETLEQQGAALLGQLFGDLTSGALPEHLHVRMPVEDPAPDGPTVVDLQLEPQTLIEALVRGED